ncbi:MAG: 6-phosphogluconolactonase [Nitrospira sp.]|nr:6-phosphogluconolactonase [Nitrospira sp.]MDH5347091.1 6-phosphogluconolactonase [Nitrospira sp.]MDH5497199.1 6-phosphogluconolactonase [Nitrospira sp.]
MAVTPDIVVARQGQEWAQKTAAFMLSVSEQAIHSTGRCLIVLSGGSTPRTLYQTIRTPEWSTRFHWSRIVFLFGDDRCVAPEHPESNFGMAQQELFQPLNIPRDHIYRMKGEHQDPTAAAEDYERTLRDLTQCSPPAFPRLDLILLGLGDDGHTASLFPGTEALQEPLKLVTVGQAPTGITHRLTLTLGVLNRAAVILFMVTGAGKAEMVRRVIESESDRSLPAARVLPDSGRLVWMLDQAAAQQLTMKRSN